MEVVAEPNPFGSVLPWRFGTAVSEPLWKDLVPCTRLATDQLSEVSLASDLRAEARSLLQSV